MTSSDLFEEMGGEQTFRDIVGRFYEQVATDEVLRPLYPEEDLGPAEERFRNFLIQYWGGPQTYSDQRGHPRLRMRHGPFRITHAERVAWLRAMRTAIDESDMPEAHQAVLWDYLERAALAMVNTPG